MKNKYIFILTITAVCSLLLSLASEGLKDLKNKNIEIDKKKNILNAVGKVANTMTMLEIDNYFTANIDTVIIDIEGNVIESLFLSDLVEIENKQNGEFRYFSNSKECLPMFIDISSEAIVIPISGKGLWSTLFGYLAISSNNFSTLKGLTFYKHKETPGLGAEISKEWFQSSFVGKEIYNNNILTSIKVTKSGMSDKSSLYEVDGISGATITSNGVTSLLLRDLKRYEPYFKKELVNEK